MILFRGNVLKRTVIALAILSLVGAAIYGQLQESKDAEFRLDIESYLPEALPEAESFELVNYNSGANSYLYAGHGSGVVGYVAVSTGPGYGGPLTVLLSFTNDGTITDISVPNHYEDKAWFDKLQNQGFFEQYIGKHYNMPLILGDDIDAITGATISSNGVAIGVQHGRELMASQLGNPYIAPNQPVNFGLPEIMMLIGLGSVFMLRTIPTLKKRKSPRYIMLAFGLGVLGIWLVRPLSLTNFSTWLVGSSPYLPTNLLLYIMVFGILGLALVFGKNFYCFWLCPFAAVQEITHGVGRGGIRPTPGLNKKLRMVRYMVLWVAIFLTLLMVNPSLSVFEPWGTLFSQGGVPIEWILLVATLIFSALIHNFWCHYICPVGAVMDIMLKMRRKMRDSWRTMILPRVKAMVQLKTS